MPRKFIQTRLDIKKEKNKQEQIDILVNQLGLDEGNVQLTRMFLNSDRNNKNDNEIMINLVSKYYGIVFKQLKEENTPYSDMVFSAASILSQLAISMGVARSYFRGNAVMVKAKSLLSTIPLLAMWKFFKTQSDLMTSPRNPHDIWKQRTAHEVVLYTQEHHPDIHKHLMQKPFDKSKNDYSTIDTLTGYTRRLPKLVRQDPGQQLRDEIRQVAREVMPTMILNSPYFMLGFIGTVIKDEPEFEGMLDMIIPFYKKVEVAAGVMGIYAGYRSGNMPFSAQLAKYHIGSSISRLGNENYQELDKDNYMMKFFRNYINNYNNGEENWYPSLRNFLKREKILTNDYEFNPENYPSFSQVSQVAQQFFGDKYSQENFPTTINSPRIYGEGENMIEAINTYGGLDSYFPDLISPSFKAISMFSQLKLMSGLISKGDLVSIALTGMVFSSSLNSMSVASSEYITDSIKYIMKDAVSFEQNNPFLLKASRMDESRKQSFTFQLTGGGGNKGMKSSDVRFRADDEAVKSPFDESRVVEDSVKYPTLSDSVDDENNWKTFKDLSLIARGYYEKYPEISKSELYGKLFMGVPKQDVFNLIDNTNNTPYVTPDMKKQLTSSFFNDNRGIRDLQHLKDDIKRHYNESSFEKDEYEDMEDDNSNY